MLGEKIYELRKKSNMSQEQLAEKLNITRQTVSNWETNQTVPDAYQLKDLSNVFQVSADEILDIQKYENINEINNNILEKNKQYLQEKLSSVSYQTWIEPIKLKSINQGIITLSVPMDFIARYLKDNFYDLLLNNLNRFSNERIEKIKFVIEQ